jgi:excisionase family DNA binding protein
VDESGTRRVTVEEAAQLLGIEKESVKKRIQRGKLRSEKDASGQVWVYLDRSETVQDQSQGQSQTDRDELVSELRDRVRSLERRLDEERESRRRADTIIAQLTQANAALASRVPKLEAPQEWPDAPEAAAEPDRAELHSATGGAQEGAQRPWWRRVFGG